jgi:hypothetical protein
MSETVIPWLPHLPIRQTLRAEASTVSEDLVEGVLGLKGTMSDENFLGTTNRHSDRPGNLLGLSSLMPDHQPSHGTPDVAS